MGVFITAGEIAVATIDDDVAGSVRVHDVADDASEFGLLAGDPARRGIGIGSALAAFAEAGSRDRGIRAMQLELLVPREFDHPSKVLLATPCDFLLYERPLS
jgi:GNAT superfamily N-acetyltransferase